MNEINSKKIEIDLSFVEKHSYNQHDVFFEMNALMGELGEFSNIIKKEAFSKLFPDYAKKLATQFENGRPSFKEQETDEAGDILFYFIKVLNFRGIALDEVVKHQIDKLNNLTSNIGTHWKK